MRSKTLCVLVGLALAFSMSLVPALGGVATATADDWVKVAGGGVDGNYHAYYHIAECIAMNGSNLYVGLNGAPEGWGPSVWQYDGSVWKMIGDNGIGDANAEAVFSMASFRSKLYVGTINGDVGCKVLRYDGGTSWTQVNENGFGDADNVSVLSMFVYHDALYAGTGQNYDAEVWRYDGSTWSRVGWAGTGMWDDSNWTISSMCEYDDMLYVGTGNQDEGAEVWQYDGATWTQVADGGFGVPSNEVVKSMAALGDTLYAGTAHYGGCEVWSYDGSNWDQVDKIVDGFGDPVNTIAYSMTVFEDQLVIGTYGHCEIWQYDPVADDVEIMAERSFDEKDDPRGPGVDQGIQVSGFVIYGPELYCCSAGIACAEVRRYQSGTTWPLISPLAFSTNQNIGVASMAMYKGQLCAGTDGQYTFGQVWRKSAQGNDWTRINEPGFGSNVMNSIDSVCAYQEGLYAGGLNDDDGCEVWRYNDSSWVQVNQDGFGDMANAQALCMRVFNDRLYVGTFRGHGGQVWSYDGSAWTQANEDGFGSEDNSSVEGMAEFNGHLYAITEEDGAPGNEGARVYRYDGGTTWTQVNEDGFGEANAGAASVAVTGEALYVGTENTGGCQVWEYNGSSWSKVADEGLGDTDDDTASSMAAFNSKLYVGTSAIGKFKGCSLFSYDGDSWTEAATPGFGDDYNDTALSMVADQNNLYVGTMNEYTGGEIWKTSVTFSSTPTFYFAEGTTRPDFDAYMCIENPGNAAADVLITYVTGDGTSKGQNLSVPASSRATVHPADVLGTGNDAAHDFSAKVECTNGQSIICERPMYFNYNGVWNGGHDVVGATAPSSTWYFAEGSCRPNFDPYLSICNPGTSAASVEVTYMKGDGGTAVQNVSVPPASRGTLHPADVLGTGNDPAHDFSAKVVSTNGIGIVAERPMYFNYNGAWTGGSDVVGANAPAPDWYFAEGTCRPNFEPYICIQNPGDATADIAITYMKGNGTTQTQTASVGAHSRSTIPVSSVLGTGNDAAHDFSAAVICDNANIICERPMYFDYNGVWNGGHDVVGATATSSAWYFAEGTCRPGFDAYLSVQNLTNRSVDVTVTYLRGNGTTATQGIAVAADSRATLHPSDVLGVGNDASHDFSATVSCGAGREIIVERPMYFDYNGWTGGSDVVGYTP